MTKAPGTCIRAPCQLHNALSCGSGSRSSSSSVWICDVFSSSVVMGPALQLLAVASPRCIWQRGFVCCDVFLWQWVSSFLGFSHRPPGSAFAAKAVMVDSLKPACKFSGLVWSLPFDHDINHSSEEISQHLDQHSARTCMLLGEGNSFKYRLLQLLPHFLLQFICTVTCSSTSSYDFSACSHVIP